MQPGTKNTVTAMAEYSIADLRYFRSLPKSDLHNHGLLGGRKSHLEKYLGRKIKPFRMEKDGIASLNRWIREEVRPFFDLPAALEKALTASFRQAKIDGISLLEMSIDVSIPAILGISARQVADVLNFCHSTVAPQIDFRPEVGFPRNQDPAFLMRCFEPFLLTGYFVSIDLYDDEGAGSPESFRNIYRVARAAGLKCKAHAGEFGSAGSVRETAEILELDAIQHGIAAADSPEVMKWLAQAQLPLNICPTSNIRMQRVRRYCSHPIRTLFDHGVIVTINTDDVTAFGDGVSEQYLKLLKAGVFSREELEIIRKNGLMTAS